jgi:hypothetical protein
MTWAVTLLNRLRCQQRFHVRVYTTQPGMPNEQSRLVESSLGLPPVNYEGVVKSDRIDLGAYLKKLCNKELAQRRIALSVCAPRSLTLAVRQAARKQQGKTQFKFRDLQQFVQ